MDPVLGTVVLPDGRALGTWTWGVAGPVVVLEAGIGLAGRSWARVAALLANRARVVAHDRAGYGRSTPDPAPRTLDRQAEDLCAVVRATGADEVLLVGHSWGGVVCRRAVELLPDGLVTGLVLVDPSDEGASAYFTRRAAVATRAQAALLGLLARTPVVSAGLRRILAGRLGTEDLAATVQACGSRSAVVTAAREHRLLADGLRRMRDAASWPRCPVTVLSGTRGVRPHSVRGRLVEAQRLRGRLPGARWVEATGSGHLVQLDQPRLVADEVLALLA